MVRVSRSTILTIAVTVVLIALFSEKLPVFASVVFGTSMLPTLRPLDIVIAVKPWVKKVRVGEIAIVEVDGVRLVHRVIEIKDGYVITKGDNNRFADPPTRIVLGVVVAIIPREAVFLTIALLAITASRPRRWLAIASAPLAGIVLASIAIMIATSTLLQSISSIVHMPHLRMLSFRTSIARTIVKLGIGNASITSARCWVEKHPAKVKVLEKNGKWLLEIAIPVSIASKLVQERSYVAFSCMVELSYRDRPYVYRMYKTENVPRAARFEVRIVDSDIAVKATATPFGLPLNATITIAGCMKTERVRTVVYTSKFIYIPWACHQTTLVRIVTRVAGTTILRVHVIQPKP